MMICQPSHVHDTDCDSSCWLLVDRIPLGLAGDGKFQTLKMYKNWLMSHCGTGGKMAQFDGLSVVTIEMTPGCQSPYQLQPVRTLLNN